MKVGIEFKNSVISAKGFSGKYMATCSFLEKIPRFIANRHCDVIVNASERYANPLFIISPYIPILYSHKCVSYKREPHFRDFLVYSRHLLWRLVRDKIHVKTYNLEGKLCNIQPVS